MITSDDKGGITIVVPVAAPLLNQVLAMPLKSHMRLKRLCHQLLFHSLTTDDGQQIATHLLASGSSMPSLQQDYYLTTRPRTSRKRGTDK